MVSDAIAAILVEAGLEAQNIGKTVFIPHGGALATLHLPDGMDGPPLILCIITVGEWQAKFNVELDNPTCFASFTKTLSEFFAVCSTDRLAAFVALSRVVNVF